MKRHFLTVLTATIIFTAGCQSKSQTGSESATAQDSTAQAATSGAEAEMQETQNERAVQVLNRVKEKLTGRDFKADDELTVITQVDKLLIEATKLENLCQHYIGWCSFW